MTRHHSPSDRAGRTLAPSPRGRAAHGWQAAARWRRTFVAGVVAFLIGVVQAADQSLVTEHQLKAAIVPKLPLFITWPDSAFADKDSPVRIGVLGPNPFGPHLIEALRGKRVGPRELSLEACPTAAEAARCHLVFIATGSLDEARSVLRSLGPSTAVTVCDLPGFHEAGGMITLVTENKRIGLVINPAALRAAGLRPDPQLLRVARIAESTALRQP